MAPFSPLCQLFTLLTLKVLARLSCPRGGFPGIPCLIGVLSLFLPLIPVNSRLFLVFYAQKGLHPGAIPGGFEERGECAECTVLISKRELFRFCVSLCTRAFCGGFLCPSTPVSGREEVYS